MSTTTLQPPDLHCACHMRDAGIDAMAALDHSLALALEGLPDDQQRVLKQTVGRLMADIADALIHPAVTAFPEIAPDQATWKAVATRRAAERAASFN